MMTGRYRRSLANDNMNETVDIVKNNGSRQRALSLSSALLSSNCITYFSTKSYQDRDRVSAVPGGWEYLILIIILME